MSSSVLPVYNAGACRDKALEKQACELVIDDAVGRQAALHVRHRDYPYIPLSEGLAPTATENLIRSRLIYHRCTEPEKNTTPLKKGGPIPK